MAKNGASPLISVFDARLSRMMLVVALAVLAFGVHPTGAATLVSGDISVLEAAVRWVLARDREAVAGSRIYLSLDQADPPEALLRRLADISELHRVSKCPHRKIGGRQLPEPEPGASVILLHTLKRHDGSRASVWVIRDGPQSPFVACREYFRLGDGVWTHAQPQDGEETECGIK